MNDQIDQAIAAADRPAPLELVEVPILIASTGRPAVVGIPIDVTEAEVLELVGWIASSLRKHLAANARSRIEIARSIPRQ